MKQEDFDHLILNLGVLDLSAKNPTAAQIEMLRDVKGCSSLLLRSCCISDEVMSSLVSMLKNNKSITNLDLSCSSIKDN